MVSRSWLKIIDMSGLNAIFHWFAHFSISFKSWLRISNENFGSSTTTNKDVSSAKIRTSDFSSSVMSLI